MSLKSFFDYLEIEKKYSSNTIEAYRNDLNVFARFLIDEFDVTNINNTNYTYVRSWIVDLVNKGISNRSINRKITSLNSYFKFVLKIDLINENPLTNHKALKTQKKIQLPFSENEMLSVLDLDNYEDNFTGIRDRLIIDLFYTTGIRRIELIQLKISDLNINNKHIKVLGKRNKERIIPLIDSTINILNKYLSYRDKLKSEETFLFITNKGKPVYEKLIYRIINKYFDTISTKVKKSPHIIRHSFATHLLNNGADLNSVKDLLGHSSLAATQVYTNRSIDEIKKVFAKSHPRNI
jgi:integrase/recombinase XerC